MGRVHREAYLALGYRVIVATRGSLDALLDESAIVSICTPTPTHAELASLAIRHGRDVVVEKPLAARVDEGEALLGLADRAGVRLFPAHVCRYVDANAELHRAVTSEELGRLMELRFSRAVPHPQQTWYATAASGGIGLDLMIHDLDLASWIGGPVTEVEMRSTRTASTATLRHISGLASTVISAWSGSEPAAAFEAVGSLGSRRHSGAPADDGAYLAMLRDFTTAAATGAEARVTARDGLEAVRLAS
jgi:myo-inositol 2-dehydrogenase/D-chiro-inositol 1-dehydrogenase